MKKTILVTGGTGFIGSHTVVELIKTGHDVVIVDNLFNSKITVLDAIEELTGTKPTFYKVDLRDQAAIDNVFDNHNVDSVIHFAGFKAVPESVEKPLMYYDNNIGGTINLLQAMANHEVKRIVFSSSACVYGEQDEYICHEDMKVGCGIANPYGRTKFMIEEILKDASIADAELEVVILRYFNPVGNHESGIIGEDPNGIPLNLMPIVMKVAIGELKELSIYGDDYPTPDGTAIRDYIHVSDLATGHIAALEHMRPGAFIYNLGTGRGTSVKEMIDAFEKARGQKLPKKIAPRRAGDLPETVANPAKAKKDLKWQTKLDINDAMRDTIKYLKHTGHLK